MCRPSSSDSNNTKKREAKTKKAGFMIFLRLRFDDLCLQPIQEIPEDEKIRREFNRDLAQYPAQSMTIF